jgi:hypothetical protein
MGSNLAEDDGFLRAIKISYTFRTQMGMQFRLEMVTVNWMPYAIPPITVTVGASVAYIERICCCL